MTVYPIASDEHYGWLTGIGSDGRQVLAAEDVVLFFDAEGTFLALEDLPRDPDWRTRAAAKVAIRRPIEVREFSVKGRQIGVRRQPTSHASDSDFLSRWHRDGLFEFQLGDDFWMSPDGTVNSH